MAGKVGFGWLKRLGRLRHNTVKTYTIRHDPIRERKGLKPWAVFEQVEPDFREGGCPAPYDAGGPRSQGDA